MARLPRLTLPGYPHHVIQRGNNRQAIFTSTVDYQTLLDLLRDNAQKFGVAIHAYVLMSNHFHLLATPQTADGLPQMMQAAGRSYVRAFNKLFNSDEAAIPLNQPMLFIHEGHRPTRVDDIKRVLHDYSVTKKIQAGEKVDLQEAFEADPAVETGYNVMKQALDKDLDVLVFAHSGGGAESVEALNLLSSQGYHDKIGEHVKIVIMAGASPAQDAVEAGVKPGNALYIGMKADLVAELGHVYIDAHDPMSGLVNLVKDLRDTSDFTLGPMHSPDQAIVPNNLDHLQNFFNHGIGGTYLAETPPAR